MDDDAWRVIEKVPRGARSRTVNTAILDWPRSSARREAAARMDDLRARLRTVGTEEIVDRIRQGPGATTTVIVVPDALLERAANREDP